MPPYSPGFSPIEEAFSKLEALLRRAAARTRETLVEAMGRALDDVVTPRDALGWFVHCAGTRPEINAREHCCESRLSAAGFRSAPPIPCSS